MNLKKEVKNLKEENEQLKEENGKLRKENSYLRQEIENLKNNQNSNKKEEYNFINNNNLNDIKIQVLQNQEKMRKNPIKERRFVNENENKNVKLNKILEDMCVYGNIIKKEIKKENTFNKSDIISTKDALKLEKKDQGLFALGLLANNLNEIGIKTIIDLNNNNNNENKDEATTSLQFISNGLIYRKKYDLFFDFGKKRNEELLKNKYQYEDFKNK
jgi:hypothetical protein